VIGRDVEIRRAIQVYSATKNQPVLIGEPGVGKTAIVRRLGPAHRRRGGADSLKEPRRGESLDMAHWLRAPSSAVSLKSD
jgi:ATP-dependent Clp protease ATP-binding subunit ClpB